MNTARTIHFGGIAALTALLLGGCAGLTRKAVPAKVPVPEQAAHEGRACQVEPEESLLTIWVYRGGTLARAGHNHVVASHDLAGVVNIPDDLTRASFEVRIPVMKLTVDESELRAEAGPDFPAEVPDAAKEGTRHNMLSKALLDAEQYPEIVLRSESVAVIAPNDLLAQVQVAVKDQTHSASVPVRYELGTDELTASGEFPLKQSDLGLTPFSVMLGAIQVQDEMKIHFKLHCTFSP